MFNLPQRNILFRPTPPPTPLYSPPVPDNAVRLLASHVVDGDGFWALQNGQRSMVRLLGLDAPEYDESLLNAWPIGAWSRAFLHNLVSGQVLLCTHDRIQPSRDRYERRLLWCWRATDLLFVNATQVLGGAARTRPDFPSNYTALLANCQQIAKTARRGIWKDLP
jgi:endonuclease YncB( thermonuclease family)